MGLEVVAVFLLKLIVVLVATYYIGRYVYQ